MIFIIINNNNKIFEEIYNIIVVNYNIINVNVFKV